MKTYSKESLCKLERIQAARQNEMGYICCLWLDNKYIFKGEGILMDSDFTDTKLRKIKRASEDEIKKGKIRVDLITMKNHFLNDEDITLDLLLEIDNASPSAAKIDEFIMEIKKYSFNFNLLKLAYRIEREVEQTELDHEDWKNKLEIDIKALWDSSRNHLVDEGCGPAVYAVQELQRYQNYKDNPAICRNIKYGQAFRTLDLKTGGLWLINFIVASVNAGKSAIGLNLACDISLVQGIPVLYLNLEMMREDLIRRAVSSLSEVPSDYIYAGSYTNDKQWKTVQDITDLIRETGTLFITQNKPRTISEIISQIYHFKSRHGIKVFFIDHLGDITPDFQATKEQNTNLTFGRYVQSIKNICTELDLRCVILHQYNRQGDRNPSRDNISLSWQVLQKADVMLSLAERDGEYSLEILKHRHRGRGYKIPLIFKKNIHKFEEVYNGWDFQD